MTAAPFSLAGRRALVTGSSQGIGLALARALAQAGAAVVLNGRDPAKLASTAALLAAESVAVTTHAFDVTDEAFLTAYFEILHRALERDGVDFWWIDWQSGPHSRVAGIDPLWMLNHFHFLDSARDGKRPLTFSRYAGPGSHRYPVGFSGDTLVKNRWYHIEVENFESIHNHSAFAVIDRE